MEEQNSYIVLTDHVTETLNEKIDALAPDKVGILVDENTHKHCLPHLNLKALPHIFEIKSGEEHKTLDTCAALWLQMTQEGFSRNSLLINLGGGVIGDMGGFVAATYKRGIRFITLPTTLLSQVDASIGGKLGVDFHGLKNHIGVFQLPAAVIIWEAFLKTLPPRELRSGFAEVIKHALIYDAPYFDFLASSRFPDDFNWKEVVAHATRLKQTVVDADPKESGLRKILNYGHTVGHAIETWNLNQGHKILHGEAIALGMRMENEIAVTMGLIDAEASKKINQYLRTIYPEHILMPESDELISLMRQDKKNIGSDIRMSLLSGIGICRYDVSVSKETVQAVLNKQVF